MKIEIKNRFNDKIIFCEEYASIKDALEKNRNANLYGADLEGADLEGADLEGANLYGADLEGANLYGADLEGADLEGANLKGADLEGANLKGANLKGADLEGANLYGVNLKGANLYGTNLYGAKGVKLPILNITGSVHSLFYINNNIKIGCEEHSIDFWIENYKEIGEKNDYTETEIEEYKNYIFMVHNLIKKQKKLEVK